MQEFTPGVRSNAFYRAFLCGYGGLFFAPHPVSGALFLLATFSASIIMGTAVLLGIFVATATAHFLKRAYAEVDQGLYGFNGALVAFALFSLQGESEQLFLWLIPSAALTTIIGARLLDGHWGQRWGLPFLSIPSLLVAFVVGYLLTKFSDYHWYPSALMQPYLHSESIFDPTFYGTGMRDAVGEIASQWVFVVLFGIGFGIYSKRLLGLIAIGLALGAAIGWTFLGWYGAFDFMLVCVTILPVFVALAGVFTAGTWQKYFYATLGSVAAFAVWFYGGIYLASHDLPLLTAPFAITVSCCLIILRFDSKAQSKIFPSLVPLHRAGVSVDTGKWLKEREFGLNYWSQLNEDKEKSWRDYNPNERMEHARELIRSSNKIVVLSGAGISTESGIPDYRTGVLAWKQYDTSHFRWEQFMASEASRQKYWEMSQDFYLVLRKADPNPAHFAIGELARRGKLKGVITQNVDCLHQKGGVPDELVCEIHGNEHQVSCLNCGAKFSRDLVYQWILDGVSVPYCPTCQGILKPDSIAFDQPMPEGPSLEAMEMVRDCDLMLVVGTSLEVQPVASLPLLVLRAGKPLLISNLHPTDYDPFADFVLRGKCGLVLPELLRAGDIITA